MIEKPVQALQWRIPVNSLENIKKARNRFVVGRMKTERPAVFGQEMHNLLKLILQLAFEVGTGFQKILEICGGENQHLARTVATKQVIPFVRLHDLRPAHEV